MLTAKFKKTILKHFRKAAYWRDYDHLMNRLSLKMRIEECTENGKIAVCRSGHDCDLCYYDSVRIIDAPVSVFAFERAEDRHREYLDGPESMWIDKPSKHAWDNFYQSRDVAAEMAGY